MYVQFNSHVRYSMLRPVEYGRSIYLHADHIPYDWYGMVWYAATPERTIVLDRNPTFDPDFYVASYF